MDTQNPEPTLQHSSAPTFCRRLVVSFNIIRVESQCLDFRLVTQQYSLAGQRGRGSKTRETPSERGFWQLIMSDVCSRLQKTIFGDSELLSLLQTCFCVLGGDVKWSVKKCSTKTKSTHQFWDLISLCERERQQSAASNRVRRAVLIVEGRTSDAV